MEEPIIFMRKHIVILFGHTFLYLVLGAFPFITLMLFPDLVGGWLGHPIIGPITLLLAATFELLVLLLFYHSFMDWYLDIWVVTNERIVDIDQTGVFGREIHELQLLNLQDVTVEIKGFAATIFGYGTIRAQTAGAKAKFEFQGLPRPQEISKQILELAHKDRRFHSHAPAETSLSKG